MNIKKAREELRYGKTIYDMSLNVVYYARVSTDKDDQLNSLSNQKKYFEDMINENRNWNFCGSYIDEGISGTGVKNRNSFLRMINDASCGKFDLILTKEISRFSRNTVDSIKYTEFLLKSGVIVYFLSDNLNTIYEDSEFRLTIMSSLAQDEVRKLSQRVKFAINRMIKDRKLIGGNLTGYYKKNGRYYINQKESFIIKYLFETYSCGKVSLKQIGEDLATMGYFNSKGKTYSQTTLSKFLTNPRYKGYYTARLTEVEDYKTHKKRKVPKEKQVIEKDDRIPSIVSEELWDRANQLYEKRKKLSARHVLNTKKSFNNFKYSGLLFCNHCNTIYVRAGGSNRKNNPTWFCKKYKIEGINFCESPIIKESLLDEIFIEIFYELFKDKNILFKKIFNEYKSIICNRMENNINNKIVLLEKQKDKLLDLSLNGFVNDSEFKIKNDKLNIEINFLKEKELSVSFDDSLDTLHNFFDKLNIEMQLSNLIKTFIDKVLIEKINGDRKYVRIYIFFKFNHDVIIKELMCSCIASKFT